MQEENFKERDYMSFEGFCVCVRHDIQQKLGKGFTVTVETVTKNNSIRLTGLLIKEQDSNVFPILYMEGYYNRYMKGESIGNLESDVLHTYWENKSDELFESGLLTDWQKASERIIFKLINYELNRTLLEDVPHCQFLDLAIVCEHYLGSSNGMSVSLLIHKGLLEIWGINWDTLYAVAVDNTPRLRGIRFSNMKEVLTGEIGCNEMEGQLQELSFVPLYVLTNQDSTEGAGCILYKNLLQEIADRFQSDMYIIPSSIHEVLLLPVSVAGDYEGLPQVIREVNRTQVAPEEVLSDNAYIFNRTLGNISIMEEVL